MHCETTMRPAWILLSRVRIPLPRPGLPEGRESLRSPCCSKLYAQKPKRPEKYDIFFYGHISRTKTAVRCRSPRNLSSF
ncbi:hypothetical protein PoB_005766400 [Plakobranchus ocellatus]|uniref:Uncharacterized protein n=1 Tax=Plakobranchus ocellatus TaxID=259542 RepID=A0AAV4CEU7_9GAST|nr:hypothetical protein PoB_005766400 [Plakobranchus ocellatus]